MAIIKNEDKMVFKTFYPHCSCGDPTLFQSFQFEQYLIFNRIRFLIQLFLRGVCPKFVRG